MHKPAWHMWLKQEHEDKAWSLVNLNVAREAPLWEKVAGEVGFSVQQGRDEWEAVKGAKRWDRGVEVGEELGTSVGWPSG